MILYEVGLDGWLTTVLNDWHFRTNAHGAGLLALLTYSGVYYSNSLNVGNAALRTRKGSKPGKANIQ